MGYRADAVSDAPLAADCVMLGLSAGAGKAWPMSYGYETLCFCVQVEGMQLVIDDLVGSTGLELKVDPGVPYVYAGFAGNSTLKVCTSQ